MLKLLTQIYDYFRARRVIGGVLLVVVCAVLVVFASRIKLSEDITDFLPKTEQNEDISFVLGNINSQQKIVFNIIAEDKERSIECSEFLVEKLDSLASDYITSTLYNIDQNQIFETSDFIASNPALYIDESGYARLDSLDNATVRESLKRSVELISSPVGAMMQRFVQLDPLSLTAPKLEQLKELNSANNYQLYDGYMFSADSRRQVVIVNCSTGATETARNTLFATQIEEAVTLTLNEFDDVEIAYFGAPLAAVTNATQIKNDSLFAVVLSVVLILGLLWYSLRSFRAMLLIAVPVAFGALFSVAIIDMIQGEISSIALGTSSIILGIAVNYSIHFVSHYIHIGSSRQTVVDIARPMITGCLSAVGAFLALMFIRAEAMRDFGLFAALALVGSLLFVLVVLPHLMPRLKLKHFAFERFSNIKVEKHKSVLIVLLLLVVVSIFFAGRVTFDTNMHNINFMTDRQREDLKTISDDVVGEASIFVAAVGGSVDDALENFKVVNQKLDSLRNCGRVLSYSSIGDFVPSKSEQQRLIDRWNSVEKERVAEIVESEAKEVGFRSRSFDKFKECITKDYAAQGVDYFYELPFVREFIIDTPQKGAVVAIVKTPIDQKESVEEFFLSLNGVVAFDSTSVNSSMLTTLKESLSGMLYICLAIVLVVLWFSFRRLELALTSFIPVVLSWFVIVGVMGMFDIHFNIINIVLVTFIFGLGDDFGIFITEGLIAEYAYRRNLTKSFKSSIMLAAITTFFGIGTLIFAKHPAMLSLAQLTIIGMLSVLVMVYIVPPFIYDYFVYKKGKPRRIPITIRNLSYGVLSFTFFIFGSIYLTLLGFVLLTLLKPTDKRKLLFHKALHRVSGFVARNIPGIKNRIINRSDETFDKPAVIIANHQSHLDLMYMLMLNPKIVILTNRWVWRSPFYGAIIRYADFYPIADGIEDNISKLEALIDNGYSVVIFPEGTRTSTGEIGRFHKGAFYLAHKVGVDVLPVTIHGLYEALPKEQFTLNRSRVTVEIGERFKVESDDYLAHSKEARRKMRQTYNELKEKYANFDFYRQTIVNNYLYKGAAVEREVERVLRDKRSRDIIETLPKRGVILIKECGVGVLPLLASLINPELQVYATTTDSDKLLLASLCRDVPPNLHYVDSEDIEVSVEQTIIC